MISRELLWQKMQRLLDARIDPLDDPEIQQACSQDEAWLQEVIYLRHLLLSKTTVQTKLTPRFWPAAVAATLLLPLLWWPQPRNFSPPAPVPRISSAATVVHHQRWTLQIQSPQGKHQSSQHSSGWTQDFRGPSSSPPNPAVQSWLWSKTQLTP
ncbi:MAG: hypothetical protein DWQ01_12365 [Planctomycetota bacterium]|nr:MAG: hypothetical protein DWQ01_12365 [Planctomycetota bacterium]